MDCEKSQNTENPPEETSVGFSRMSRKQLLTLVSMAAVNVFSNMCFALPGPFFPAEAERKGVSRSVIGLIFGCRALFTFAGSLILSKYIVQIGAKFMIIAGLFMSGSGTILFGVIVRAPSGAVFTAFCFIIRIFNAIGFSSAITASFAISARVFPNNVAAVLGFLEIFSGIGFIMGPPVGGLFYHAFGYEWTFGIVGAMQLLTLPINAYILPTVDSVETHGSFLALFKHVKVIIICGLLVATSTGLAFLDTFLSIFVTNQFHQAPLHVGLITMAMTLPYGILSPLFGFICDKYPSSRMTLMFLGALVSGLGYIFLGPIPSLHVESQLWLSIIMLIIIGTALCISSMPVFAALLSFAEEKGFESGLGTSGLVSGLFSAMWSAGTIFGPTLGGYIVQKLSFSWGSVIQGVFSLFIAALLGVFCIFEIFQKKRLLKANGIEPHSERAPLLS